MYSFEIRNKSTNEIRLIFGYSIADAFHRENISNPENWQILHIEYED